MNIQHAISHTDRIMVNRQKERGKTENREKEREKR